MMAAQKVVSKKGRPLHCSASVHDKKAPRPPTTVSLTQAQADVNQRPIYYGRGALFRSGDDPAASPWIAMTSDRKNASVAVNSVSSFANRYLDCETGVPGDRDGENGRAPKLPARGGVTSGVRVATLTAGGAQVAADDAIPEALWSAPTGGDSRC